MALPSIAASTQVQQQQQLQGVGHTTLPPPPLPQQQQQQQPITTWVHDIFQGKLVNETRCLQVSQTATEDSKSLTAKLLCVLFRLCLMLLACASS